MIKRIAVGVHTGGVRTRNFIYWLVRNIYTSWFIIFNNGCGMVAGWLRDGCGMVAEWFLDGC